MRTTCLVTAALASLASCGTGTTAPGASGSTGLKIFVTSRAHIADFANDPSLTGASGVAKADSFCNTDPAKPSAATYKALLVDGVNRDARAPVDWVLKPATAYYRAHGDVLIGTTTAAAIFGAAYQSLANSIAEPATPSTIVWTGLGSATDFSTGNHCNRWTDFTNAYSGARGIAQDTGANAFHAAGDAGCYYFQFPIYCVEQ